VRARQRIGNCDRPEFLLELNRRIGAGGSAPAVAAAGLVLIEIVC